MKTYLDNYEKIVAREWDEAEDVLSSRPLTNSPEANRALAREGTAILRKADPSISREDVTRTDYVHTKTSLNTIHKAGVPLADELPNRHQTAARFPVPDFVDPAGRHDEPSEDSVSDIEAAASREFECAQRFVAGEQKDYFEYQSAIAKAKELQALARNTQRRVIQNHNLFGDRFEAALVRNDLESAEAQLIEALSSEHADYALQITCVRALIEIQSLYPDHTPQTAFDGKWLASRAGLQTWTAQRLMNDACKIESGVAALLIGTPWGKRKELRDLLDAAPSRRREIVKAVGACVTKYVMEHEIKVQAKRRRKLSLTELNVLDFVGLNIGPVREAVADMEIAEAIEWLAAKLDDFVKRMEVSKRRERRTAEQIKTMQSELKSRTRAAA
jgi:hypothetical protein